MADRTRHIEKLIEDIQVLKRRMFFQMAGHLKDGHITGSQWLVLRQVGHSEGTTLKEVARMLAMTSSAVTQLVEPLVAKGYLVRKTSVRDGRALELMLSSKSKKQIASFRTASMREMKKTFGTLTDKEFKEYCRLHAKISASLMAS